MDQLDVEAGGEEGRQRLRLHALLVLQEDAEAAVDKILHEVAEERLVEAHGREENACRQRDVIC